MLSPDFAYCTGHFTTEEREKVCVCVREKEREKVRERKKERERETDRQTDRQTEKENTLTISLKSQSEKIF